MVDHPTLIARRVVKMLCAYSIDPIVAVRPDQIAGLDRTVGVLRDAGLDVALWPMLDDRDGRWAGPSNSERFCDLANAVIDAVSSFRGEVVLDLEPSFSLVKSLTSHRHAWSSFIEVQRESAAHLRDASDRYSAFFAAASARGVDVSATVVPLLVHDDARHGWGGVLGVPIDAAPWSRASVMAYTSIVEGWSRGWVDRDDAVSLLATWTQRGVARFGSSLEMSLGAVGVGALGDEPVYRSVSELAVDVSIARRGGASSLALFDLGGVLQRPPAERWLEAFVSTEPAPLDVSTGRGRLISVGLDVLGRGVSRLRAVR